MQVNHFMSKNNDIGSRLLFFCDMVYGGNKSLFSRELGYDKPQTLTDYFNNATKPGNKLKSKLLEIGMNLAWLEYGIDSPFADNEAGRALAQKFSKQGASETDANATTAPENLFTSEKNTAYRRKKWRLVRRWLTETDTVEEFFFTARKNVKSVTFDYILSLEGNAPEMDLNEDFLQWISGCGIDIDWIFAHSGNNHPFSHDHDGEKLEAKITARFSAKKSVPESSALPEYSEPELSHQD